MKYTLVKPDGSIGQSREFDGNAPTLAPNKGRWLLDSPPAYEPTTHNRSRVEPIAANAVEIPYSITPRDPAVIAAEQAVVAEQQTQKAIKLSVSQEIQVQSFIVLAPAQVNSYIDSNVTDLNSAKTVLKFFGRMLLLLVRREYRNLN